MKKTVALAFTACALATAVPAAAQITVEGNGARADDRWGGELGIGYGFGAAGFKLTPIIGALIYAGDNDRYREDDLSNGQTSCRDTTNGQFADDDRCNNTKADAYAKVEATYSIPLVATVGAGVRLSERRTTPYGTVALPLAPTIKLKGNVGDGYYALGLRFNL